MKLVDWLSRHFRVDEFQRGEARFSCPKCGHESFYFNTNKRIGFCHHDACHWTPDLQDLEALAGDTYDGSDSDYFIPEESEQVPVEVSIPGSARPLVIMEKGKLLLPYPTASLKVSERGVSVEDQYRFKLHIDMHRVYIPVYTEGELVSYVGRQIWWTGQEGMKYLYPEGAPVSKHIFNWDEAQSWEHLSLVENTFNGIWLRSLQCTSNFGSNLSDTQMRLIASSSAVRTVVLLWDHGAQSRAEAAVRKLRTKYGIAALHIQLARGQPDDYDRTKLDSLLQKGKARAPYEESLIVEG